MADLPQDQQPIQTQPFNISPPGQSSVTQQPPERPQQPDKPSFPPTQAETPPPADETLKSKLSSLGIKPSKPGGPPKKGKIVLAALALLLLFSSIPAAVFLVQQRQELRERAYPGQVCTKDTDCSGYGSPNCEVCVNQRCQTKTCSGDQCLGYGTCTCRAECYISGDGYICCNGSWVSQAQGCPDCAPPETPTPTTPPQITCSADSGGVRATNNTSSQVCGNYFIGKCRGNYSCLCGGTPTQFCLNPGQSMSRGLDLSGFCGSWQTDISIGDCHASDHGCEYCEPTPTPTRTPTPTPTKTPTPTPTKTPTPTPTPTKTPTPTPTPTLPPDTARCDFCKVYNEDWEEIDPATIYLGQTVYFATKGSTTDPGGITKARFRINGGANASWCTGTGRAIIENWCETETTTPHDPKEFYVKYTISEAGSYTVQSEVYNPALGWK